jgi:hypothetical protein
MAAIITDGLWTPPEGMNSIVRTAWIAFYSRALDVYGVTPERYRTLYEVQKGRCWICRTAKGINPLDPKGAGSRRLGIDHNHATGQVRGLLCTGGDKTCNRIIGWLNATQLRRAAEYLDGTMTPGMVLDLLDDRKDLIMSVLWGPE